MNTLWTLLKSHQFNSSRYYTLELTNYLLNGIIARWGVFINQFVLSLKYIMYSTRRDMFTLTYHELQAFITDDIPYLDLTTHLQEIKGKQAKLSIYTREDIILSSIEEAYIIAKLFDCRIENATLQSGVKLLSGHVLITIAGEYNAIHQAWRSIQIILEYSCKMATYAYEMLQAIRQVNPHCELLATRKSFPFAKRFCIKSIMVGGALPHRLGLSETILLFDHHRKVYSDTQTFYDSLVLLKTKAPEKKIVVESTTLDDAIMLMQHHADVLQLDKMELCDIQKIVEYRNAHYLSIKILVAGGIELHNAQQYAALGIDAIVTSKLYSAGMANLGSKLEV